MVANAPLCDVASLDHYCVRPPTWRTAASALDDSSLGCAARPVRSWRLWRLFRRRYRHHDDRYLGAVGQLRSEAFERPSNIARQCSQYDGGHHLHCGSSGSLARDGRHARGGDHWRLRWGTDRSKSPLKSCSRGYIGAYRMHHVGLLRTSLWNSFSVAMSLDFELTKEDAVGGFGAAAFKRGGNSCCRFLLKPLVR
jgi:hypothetical protein